MRIQHAYRLEGTIILGGRFARLSMIIDANSPENVERFAEEHEMMAVEYHPITLGMGIETPSPFLKEALE